METARRLYQAILEHFDRLLLGARPGPLLVMHLRPVWLRTCLGVVRVRRRQYRDGQGRYRYLLDEALGMARYRHATAGIQEKAASLAVRLPFRFSAELLKGMGCAPVSHETLRRWVGQLGDRAMAAMDKAVRTFLATGALPESQDKKVERLFTEHDGVMVALQRESARKAEVKLGIAYEGWQKVGHNRYRTSGKAVFATAGGGGRHWAGMLFKLHERYDLTGLKTVIHGGDGAAWVRAGREWLGGCYQLDRYHLCRALRAALGRDSQSFHQVLDACDEGRVEEALAVLSGLKEKARGEMAKQLDHARRYLEVNRAGLVDYRRHLGESARGLRRTGAIEGNVDKIIAKRFKRQGMSWRLKGLSRLLAARLLYLEGKLPQWLPAATILPPLPENAVRLARRMVNRNLKKSYDQWLQVTLSALNGPASGRPWVETLRALSRIPA